MHTDVAPSSLYFSELSCKLPYGMSVNLLEHSHVGFCPCIRCTLDICYGGILESIFTLVDLLFLCGNVINVLN